MSKPKVQLIGDSTTTTTAPVTTARLVYLAGPVDAVSREEATDWREVASKHLLPEFATFSPPGAFRIDGTQADAETCRALIEINNMAIDRSCAVLANLRGRSFGTPIEVEFAKSRGIPVYGFGVGRHSIYRHWFAAWTDDDMEIAIGKLRQDLG